MTLPLMLIGGLLSIGGWMVRRVAGDAPHRS
jgi:hypothetical protein